MLDDLLSTIRRLRERIEESAAQLRGNEYATRYALVDPLLRALEWDTADPTRVRPEYTSGSGRVDYALMASGKPICLLEAKPLGGSLQDALNQVGNYSLQVGVRFLALTDGQQWQVYGLYPIEKPLKDKLVLSFDLLTTEENELAFRAMFLWYGNLQATKPSVPSRPPMDPPPVPPQPGLRLIDLQPRFYDKPPRSLQFEDHQTVSIKYWADILIEVAKWLVYRGKLTGPGNEAGKKNLVATAPLPEHGTWKPVGGGLYVNTNYNAPTIVRQAIHLLQACGCDPGKITVTP